MIICTSCSARNEDSERFCGQCGAYLEWEGERVAAAPAPVPVPVAPTASPEAEPDRPGLIERILSGGARTGAEATTPGPTGAARTASGTDGAGRAGTSPAVAGGRASGADDGAAAAAAGASTAAPSHDAPAGGTTTPATVPPSGSVGAATPGLAAPTASASGTTSSGTTASGTTPSGTTPSGTTSWSPAWSDTEPSGASADGPTSGGAPTGFGVAQPAAPLASPPPPPPPPPEDEPPPAPGDLVCGRCGAGNVPTRKFCRRCGNDLADAPVAARPPWWRRLFRRRPRAALVAGTRPVQRRRRRFPTRVLTSLVVLAALVAGVGFGADALRTVYETVLDRLQEEAIRPARVEATAELPGQEKDLALDGTTDRSWSPGPPDTAPGQSLQLTFDEPFRLVAVLVTPGASAQQEQFLLQGRPRDVVVQATQSDGTVHTDEFRLPDEVGDRELGLAVDDVVAVTLTIGSVYPAQDPGAPVAVGEVEIFGRR